MSETDTTVESAAPVPAPEPAVRPGRALADARISRNQTVAEIALQLKLSVSQVEALEADDYARLPGPVFVRGFVRNYARLMELDGEALVAGLKMPLDPLAAGAAIPHSHNIPFPDGRGPRWPIYAALIAVLAVIVVLFEFIYSSPPAEVTDAPAPPAPVVAQPVFPPQSDISAVMATQPVAEPAQPAPVSVPVAVPAPMPAEVPAPAPASAPPTQQTPVAAPEVKRAGAVEMKMIFEKQSWVEVRERDDRIVFSQLSPAGAVQIIQVVPPLNVVIGSASGVKVTYKGRSVDLAPHAKNEVARFTLE
jgi:cytoskeleton protein RodZ